MRTTRKKKKTRSIRISSENVERSRELTESIRNIQTRHWTIRFAKDTDLARAALAGDKGMRKVITTNSKKLNLTELSKEEKNAIGYIAHKLVEFSPGGINPLVKGTPCPELNWFISGEEARQRDLRREREERKDINDSIINKTEKSPDWNTDTKLEKYSDRFTEAIMVALNKHYKDYLYFWSGERWLQRSNLVLLSYQPSRCLKSSWSKSRGEALIRFNRRRITDLWFIYTENVSIDEHISSSSTIDPKCAGARYLEEMTKRLDSIPLDLPIYMLEEE